MKLTKKNMKVNKQIEMIIKASRDEGIVPTFCAYDECPKLIKYGQKIRFNRCEKCEHSNLNNRLNIIKERIG